jgi:hypothetical protein
MYSAILIVFSLFRVDMILPLGDSVMPKLQAII